MVPRLAMLKINMIQKLVFTAIVLLGGFCSFLFAFGQNKVQYQRFEWSYYQTAHFDIYFPQGADSIAWYSAENVEKMYENVSRTLGHELTARVPIIIHNTHAEFEQTNVIRMALHEAIGGFTEIFKNRIVLPFEGSYEEFYHVLEHEMVHAFINNMLMGGRSGGVQGTFRFPLWINEGLAEYTALKWDLGSEFFMMDATTSGYVPPPIVGFYGFLAYKGGQMFYHFLENAYGKGTIKKFLHEAKKTRNINIAFKNVTKTSLEEMGEIWLRELRYIYWPELGRRTHGKSVARQLTNHGRDLSFFNLQPAISPDNKSIAFFSDRKSREGIFILNLETEKVTRSVLQGGTQGKHESFHSFKSGLAWGPGSERLAIVSKREGKDVIHIIDVKNGKVMEEIAPDVQALLSPTWSKDGRYIGFSGSKGGRTDIYIWDRDTKKLSQLTNDIAYDGKPQFSPSGKWIAFETDRTDISGNSQGIYKDIYKIQTDGSHLTLLSSSPYDDHMPTYGASDSLLIFISNRSGVNNLYLNIDSTDVPVEHPLTNIIAGAFTPSWSQDGKQVAFTIFEQGGWDIFLMKDPLDKIIKEELPKTHFIKTLEDSSLSFFRPINWENLSSYQTDSTENKDSSKIQADSLSVAGLNKTAADSSIMLSEVDGKVDDSTAQDRLVLDSISQNQALSEEGKTDSLEMTPKENQEKPRDSSLTSEDNKTELVEADDSEGVSAEIIEESEEEKGKRLAHVLDSSVYLDSQGNYVKNSYSPKFSLDVAQAAIGVSNFEGPLGGGLIVLTDLMGDQEIQIGLDLQGDINNSQLSLQYLYLPHRVDFTVGGYYRSYDETPWSLLGGKEKSFGANAGVLYPLSTFSRLQFSLDSRYIDRETFNDTVFTERVSRSRGLFSPSMGWSFDNVQWGMTGPVNGTRIFAYTSVVPPLIEDDVFFMSADIDYRNYWRWVKKYTLAFRLSAGFSEPLFGKRNPHRYWLGGDNFYQISSSRSTWSNTANIPDELDIESLFYSDFALPLRGFRFFEFSGNRKVLANLEFRFPFVHELIIAWPIPLRFPPIMGIIFADYGAAWTYSTPKYFNDKKGKEYREDVLNDYNLKLAEYEEKILSNDTGLVEPQLPADYPLEPRELFKNNQGMGIGYGLRMNLGVFVLRWTRAYPIDGIGNAKKEKTDYWSLGAEF